MGEWTELTASDNHRLKAWKSSPKGAPKAGLVVIQEAFGVNTHIRELADRFAAAGYLAIAPALFDRIEREVELGYGPEELTKARGILAAIDNEKALLDVDAARQAVAAAGKVGVIGYCFGGLMAYLAGCRLELDASVVYYGHVETVKSENCKCPVVGHFGLQDKSISQEQLAEFRAAQPDVPIYMYEAGHGFSCDRRSSYDKVAAELALTRTAAFLSKHLVNA